MNIRIKTQLLPQKGQNKYIVGEDRGTFLGTLYSAIPNYVRYQYNLSQSLRHSFTDDT